ncbi:MAG: PIN domain-containing protein [Terriglobales bacterium]
MSRIYWDTMLFIYWLEDHPVYASRVGAIRSRMQERHDQLITSTFTFGEILAGSYRRGATDRVIETRNLLLSVVSEAIPFTLEAADHYARIRGTLGIRPADGVHLACAASANTDLFLTNDEQLVSKVIPGIQFIAGLHSDIL